MQLNINSFIHFQQTEFATTGITANQFVCAMKLLKSFFGKVFLFFVVCDIAQLSFSQQVEAPGNGISTNHSNPKQKSISIALWF
jgi:hypothetical protein